MNREAKDFLLELLSTPSPSGCEQKLQKTQGSNCNMNYTPTIQAPTETV